LTFSNGLSIFQPGSVSRGAPKPIPGHKRLTIEEINGYDMAAHLDELVPSHRKH
jgi:hypothetical protein